GRIPCSSSALSMPTSQAPRTPPPPRTKATSGAGTAGGLGGTTAAGGEPCQEQHQAEPSSRQPAGRGEVTTGRGGAGPAGGRGTAGHRRRRADRRRRGRVVGREQALAADLPQDRAVVDELVRRDVVARDAVVA